MSPSPVIAGLVADDGVCSHDSWPENPAGEGAAETQVSPDRKGKSRRSRKTQTPLLVHAELFLSDPQTKDPPPPSCNSMAPYCLVAVQFTLRRQGEACDIEWIAVVFHSNGVCHDITCTTNPREQSTQFVGLMSYKQAGALQRFPSLSPPSSIQKSAIAVYGFLLCGYPAAQAWACCRLVTTFEIVWDRCLKLNTLNCSCQAAAGSLRLLRLPKTVLLPHKSSVWTGF